MPRRRPGQLRPLTSPTADVDQAQELGLPAVTARALDRLGEPGLEPKTVALELQAWRRLVHLPTRALSAPHNDWITFVGPASRTVLADAVQTLSQRDGAPLAAELVHLDAKFEHKTSPDPSLPWWSRRGSG